MLTSYISQCAVRRPSEASDGLNVPSWMLCLRECYGNRTIERWSVGGKTLFITTGFSSYTVENQFSLPKHQNIISFHLQTLSKNAFPNIS